MVSNAQAVALQQGNVFCWVLVEQTAMDFAWVTKRLSAKNLEEVRVPLTGYDSQWRNRYYDKPEKITVCLEVKSVKGNRQDFTYTAIRKAGSLLGDKNAARDREPEWFEIHVRHSVDPKQPEKERITATWKRIPQPA